MTTIEKKMLIALAVCIIGLTVCIWHLGNAIDNAGGVKGIAVEAGKSIKDIAHEIETHRPSDSAER